MSHPEDRWASLAEELGLPTESGAAAKKAPLPSAPPAARPEFHEPEPSPAAAAPVAPPQIPERDHRDEVDDGVLAAAATPETMSSVADGPGDIPGSEVGAEDDKDRPRRRRRRRGRKPAADAAGTPANDEAIPLLDDATPVAAVATAPPGVEPPEAKPAETEEDRTRRRRRRRGRKNDRPPEEEVRADESHEPVEVEREIAEPALVSASEDDDEADDLTDLSVPSWTDLIAGLYRPQDR